MGEVGGEGWGTQQGRAAAHEEQLPRKRSPPRRLSGGRRLPVLQRLGAFGALRRRPW